jgi:lipopolysaccharide/colanic/teichoic acid biosynthesis glycosyltransferase
VTAIVTVSRADAAEDALLGTVAVAVLGLAAVYAADGFARNAFSSVGELWRAFTAVGLTAAGAALLLAQVRPGLFPPTLTLGVAAGTVVAGLIAAPYAVIPASRGGRHARPRALLLASSDEDVLGAVDHCSRLAEAVELLGRVEVRPDHPLTAEEILDRQPELVLVEALVTAVDFEVLRLCSERAIRVLVLVRPPFGLAIGKSIVRLGGLPWVSLAPFALAPRHLRAKRALDLLVVLLAAPAVLLFAAVVAVTIATTSRGGVFYRQQRVGKGGKPFRLLKFRTMYANAEHRSGPVLATVQDPRVTRIGVLLRRLRLDELPQLWNVVRGEMSLVGPRPERPELVAGYDAIPSYSSRAIVRPGITGIAQLVGGYFATPTEKLRCDLLYVSSRSLRLDLRLIAGTAFALARGFPDG